MINLIQNKVLNSMIGGSQNSNNNYIKYFILILLLLLIKVAIVNITFNKIIPKINKNYKDIKLSYYDSIFLTILFQSLFT